MPLLASLRSGAVFDQSETYRYWLWREWNVELPRLSFVMLNPSTADADRNDPTIRRCIQFIVYDAGVTSSSRSRALEVVIEGA